MKIQTEYISFNNRRTICCSYDFKAHQQCSQRYFPRLLYSDSTCSQFCSRHSQACGRHSQACGWRSQVLPGLWLAIPSAPWCTWGPLHRYSKLWDLTTLGFWSDNSQTLLEAPSDKYILLMSTYHGTTYYGCEHTVELDAGDAWAGLPITRMHLSVAEVYQYSEYRPIFTG